MSRICMVSLVILAVVASARADELLFEYTADVLPYAEGGGFPVVNFCENPDFCPETIENGHLVVRWVDLRGDSINYFHRIPGSPETLWVEWRFRSNLIVSPLFPTCNGSIKVQFREIGDRVSLNGDHVEGGGGGQAIFGLALDEFYTVRFESRDGLNYEWSVDGRVLRTRIGTNNNLPGVVNFGGSGCVPRGPNDTLRDEWDFVRYGTISDGEAIVATNPPGGDVDANTYPNLDSFIVTFDRPGFVRVDDVTVSVTDGSDPPVVLWTRRLDNDTADRVQIVLDRPLLLGTTTTFTLDTGGEPQTVTYTYLSLGACCFDDGTCEETEESQCGAQSGVFSPGATCESARACCFPPEPRALARADANRQGSIASTNGKCINLAPVCCELMGGTPAPVNTFCDDDPDGDNLDAACGDSCPNDAFKTEPGQCGCGVPDTDSDGDTVPDCDDQCPEQDDTRDFDNNNIPDCLEFFPIPTVSTWGLLILTLLLGVAWKLAFGWRRV